jgi:hypothetical protein
MHNEFEAPTSQEREITVGDKKATYRFNEPCAAELIELFDNLAPNGEIDPAKAKTVRFRVIAAVVQRPDGSSISEEAASKMRSAVVKALYDEAMAVLGYADEGKAAGNA